MSLYVKDTIKLRIATDANYRQLLFDRSDNSDEEQSHTTMNTMVTGYAVLTNTGATNTITISAGDLSTIRSVYLEATNTVTLNIVKSSNGFVNAVVEPLTTNETARLYATANVNTGSATLTISTSGGSAGTDNAVAVAWALIGV